MKPSELQSLYNDRFSAHISYRNQVWSVLVSTYLMRYIEPQANVLDLGCGYGEFINNVVCRHRYAIDLNARAREFLNEEVTFFEQDCSAPWPLPDDSLDVVFTSNFFEHLPTKEALGRTLAQAKRCLRPDGLMIAMGPNIRFVGGAYWDFWDHHLPLTDFALSEALRMQGFQVERVVDRFLPYTMVNRRPVPSVLISLYLRFPLAWKILGKQFLIIARKQV
jgi:SAM-dependent methyltransferase